MLKNLHINDLGPSKELSFDFGTRLNFLTGDNGLGKSFVLDIVWWALTGAWPGKSRPMRPDEEKAESARIAWSENGKDTFTAYYTPKNENWLLLALKGDVHSGGLVIYARMDGGFSIHFSRGGRGRPKAPLQLTPDEVWGGSRRGGTSRCEGFYRDVGTWLQTGSPQGEMLRRVARVLSPQNEVLEFGVPKRVYLEDTLNHPILMLPYGEVPVAESSAGMRRILALSYVMTWACHEDAERSRLMKSSSDGGVTVIIDEIEAHLHPLWQRSIVPALLTALDALNPGTPHQFHVSTHSPLVLASLEPFFDEDQDSLFHFKLDGHSAVAEEIEWTPHGTSSYWLTSPIFGLGEARSREAETAIQAAKDFMIGKTENLPQNLKTKEQIHNALKNSLPGQDPFWPRWMVKTGLED
jgi:predicted ATPase